MKKTLLLAGVATALFAINANAVEFKPYVGMDYVYSDAGMKYNADEVYETKYNSLKFDVGAKLHKNFGVEVFYQQSDEEDKKHATASILGADAEISTEFKAYGVDAIGYLPLTDKLEGLGSIGFAKYDFEAEYNLIGVAKEKQDEDNIGIRFGLGLQYNITDNVAVNGMARYVKIDDSDDDVIEDITEFSIGARYSF